MDKQGGASFVFLYFLLAQSEEAKTKPRHRQARCWVWITRQTGYALSHQIKTTVPDWSKFILAQLPMHLQRMHISYKEPKTDCESLCSHVTFKNGSLKCTLTGIYTDFSIGSGCLTVVESNVYLALVCCCILCKVGLESGNYCYSTSLLIVNLLAFVG